MGEDSTTEFESRGPRLQKTAEFYQSAGTNLVEDILAGSSATMHLFFWQNLISPHQASFIRELGENGHQVVVVSAEEMSEERRRQGWKVPSLGRAQIILGPAPGKVLQIVESSPPHSIHVIAGARGTPLGRQVALACRGSRRRMGIITEAPDTRGFGGPLRWLKYSWECWSVGKSFDFILTMGEKAMWWFKVCGYPANRIFPFAYVTDVLALVANKKENNLNQKHKAIRFLFVGRLVSLKGLDILLRALARVPSVQLLVIGEGPDKNRLEELAREHAITNRISWLGQMDAVSAQAHISQADVLVLPSRKEGWGAVINESLMVGTPVICSTACGASELIQYPWLGSVFRENRVACLTDALASWSANGTTTLQHRERVKDWAKCIEGRRVARYLEDILIHVYAAGIKPQAPWRLRSRP